ncbi:hypothetical protein BH23GEM9_BH23GEM9_17820 [soil metagenome]
MNTTVRIAIALAATAVASPLPAQDAGLKAHLVMTTGSPTTEAMFWRAYNDLLHHFETRARPTLDSILALDPNVGLARLLRAHAHYLASPSLSPAERTKELERGLQDVTALSVPEREFAHGLAAASEGKLEAAEAIFRQLSDRLPDDPYAALEHANALRRLARHGGLIALQDVRRRFPTFAPVHMPLAYALYEAGDTAAAVHQGQSYAAAAPEQPYSHYVSARMLLAAGHLRAAAQAMRPVLDLPRSWFDPVEQFATVEQKAGNGAAARRVLGAVGRHSGTLEDVSRRLRYLAISYLYDGQVDSARVTLRASANRAVQQGTTAEAVLSLRFLALLEGASGAKDSAAAALSSAAGLEGSEQTAAHHVFSAQSLALAGDLDAGNDHIEKLEAAASVNGGADQAIQITRALLRALAGDGEGALDQLGEYRTAADLPFAFIAADYALGALGKVNERQAARRAWLTRHESINLRSLPLALARLRAEGRAPMK